MRWGWLSVMGRAHVALLVVLVVAAAVAPLASAQQLSIVFSKPVYDKGDVVAFTVKGLEPPATVAVEVYAPDGRLVWVHEEDNIPFTEAVFSFKLPSTAPEGVYKVYVAVEGQKPVEANFTVHRPEFIITSASISPSSARTGETVTVTVSVENRGAEGSFYILVIGRDNTTVAQVGPLTLGYMESGTYYASFTAPSVPGTFEYKVVTLNVKYGSIDSTYTVKLVVSYPPPPVVITPPPPPPPPTTTTPATTTKPATTTPPPANATAAFYAYIGDYVSPSGVVKSNVEVTIPAIGVSIVFPAGTLMLGPTGAPVRPVKLLVSVLKTAPPVEPPNIMVGPPVEVRFEGYAKVSFNQSVIVTVPYNPEKVPPGYEVRLSYYDSELGRWVPLPTVKVDPITGRVSGLAKHFTVFAAVAYRVVAPVTTTATVTTTVTVPATTTVTATKTATTTVTATRTVTATKPVTTVSTTTVTATATTTRTTTITSTFTVLRTVVQPVTVTTTKAYTVTKTTTKTAKQVVTVTASPVTVTSTSTTTATVTKTRTPGWAYASLAAAVVLVVAVIVLALRLSRRGG